MNQEENMSTDEQTKDIENLLESLQEESLKRSHASVLISFAQMQDYIQQIIASVRQRDIKYLLKTYLEMSQKYYAQFELSLLKEINNRRELENKSNLAMSLIDAKPLTDNNEIDAMKKAKELLESQSIAAVAEYQNMRDNFASYLQDALDKLKDEWQRLGTIAVASQALTKDEDLIQALEVIVEVAAYSIGVEAQRVMIVPGKEFALHFFSYLENFAIFSVPIYSVQAPWEWSIFWHELAGHQVRWLEMEKITTDGNRKTTIDEIAAKLQEFHDHYKTIEDEKQKDILLRSILPDNQFGYEYIKKLFAVQKLKLVDLGNFDHQFDRISMGLPKADQFRLYESMKRDGWCADWVKEMFEDSWSLFTLRKPFLVFLQDILNRHTSVDGRHPVPKIRLGVAMELLRLMQINGNDSDPNIVIPSPDLSSEQSTVVRVAAEQLLRFLALIRVASYKLENDPGSYSPSSVRQEKKIFVDMQEIEIQDISEGAKITIQEAIRSWSKFHESKDPSEEARKCASDIINMFSTSGSVLGRKEKRASVQDFLNASYEDLLKDKDYNDLLKLSFYDTDYGVSNVSYVYYNGIKKFDTARLQSVPADVSMGAVTYVSGGVSKRTSVDRWNAAAVPGFKI